MHLREAIYLRVANKTVTKEHFIQLPFRFGDVKFRFWLATTEKVRTVPSEISKETLKFSKTWRIYCQVTSLQRGPVSRKSTELGSQRDLHLNSGFIGC